MDSEDLGTTTTSSPAISKSNWTEVDRARRIAVCIFLAVIVAAAFGRTLGHDFVNYDDSEYVYENPHITNGLSLTSVWWAFTHVHAANWHPLTTISHMLDCQIYGVHPWGHHLTNILLHAAAAIFLFLALIELTAGSSVAALYERRSSKQPAAQSAIIDRRYSTVWPSAFVAALFAIHPLRVESVAWISERKDVLSGVFFMLTLWAYARYVRQLGKDSHSLRRYLAVVILFALGLMSKPTLVTLPFVLLLLDYWPLERFQKSEVRDQRSGGGNHWLTARALVVEKIPLFLLSVLSCAATLLAQKKVIAGNLRMTFLERADNAFVTYIAYLGEMIWPSHLVVSHPYADKYQNLPQAIAAFVLILIISGLCAVWRRRYPFLLTGWLWYLGMLIPMIGLVQVSLQARADRYTYLPQIGIYLMIAWGIAALIDRFRIKRAVVAAPAAVTVVALVCCSYAQARYWRDTETLWRHALDQSTYDYIAHDSLGYALLEKGEVDNAINEYKRALEIKPDYADSHNNLANALLQKGLVDEAMVHYRRALEIEPEFPEPHNNLANVLFKQGRVDEAIEEYKLAAAKRSDFAEVQYNLGSAFIVKGDWDAAIRYLEAAIKIDSTYARAHNKLGIAFGATGKTAEAVREFKEALRRDPKYAEAHFNLGFVLAHSGHRIEAIGHLREALRLKSDYPEARQELHDLGMPVGR